MENDRKPRGARVFRTIEENSATTQSKRLEAFKTKKEKKKTQTTGMTLDTVSPDVRISRTLFAPFFFSFFFG